MSSFKNNKKIQRLRQNMGLIQVGNSPQCNIFLCEYHIPSKTTCPMLNEISHPRQNMLSYKQHETTYIFLRGGAISSADDGGFTEVEKLMPSSERFTMTLSSPWLPFMTTGEDMSGLLMTTGIKFERFPVEPCLLKSWRLCKPISVR